MKRLDGKAKDFGLGKCDICGDLFQRKSSFHKYCPVCKVNVKRANSNRGSRKWRKNPTNDAKYRQYQSSPKAIMGRRKWKLKKEFGITLEDFEKRLIEQRFCCAICGKHQKDHPRNFDVDHNHKTGYVRGLLCSYCNRTLLRAFRDNKKIAQGLVKYLAKALKEDQSWKISR